MHLPICAVCVTMGRQNEETNGTLSFLADVEVVEG